jgi:AcrR family transcriptional regulator
MSSTALPVAGATRSTALPVAGATRRHLSDRQADTVQRLAEATVAEVRAVGYEGLTVRNVARRAGVAPATAYTYFSSKEHLVAEVFWRRLGALPDRPVDRRRRPVDRVAGALRDIGLLVADEPELAAACTTAMLASDPEVAHLRARIGAAVTSRMQKALGDGADPAVLRALELAFSGAMVQAGVGLLGYDEVGDRMAEVAGLVLRSGA